MLSLPTKAARGVELPMSAAALRIAHSYQPKLLEQSLKMVALKVD